MRKFLKWFAIVFGVLFLLVGGVVAFVLTHLDDIANEYRAEWLPEVEKILGRDVEIGDIELSILPVFGAKLPNIVVKGAKEGDEDLLRIESIDLSVNLWVAVKSMGKDVQLNGLIIRGLGVNLVREKDGTLSYQDIIDRLAKGPPPEEEPPKPLDPELIEKIKNARLKRIALEDGSFKLIDKATGGAPAETYIKKLLVELDDVVLAEPFELHVAAAIFAEQSNFDFRVKVGPVPIGAPPPKPGETPEPVPVEFITLKADGIDLARIIPYLGDGVPVKLASAAFRSDLRIDDPLGLKGPIKVDGDFGVTKIQLTDPKPGKIFDLKVSPKIFFDPKKGVLDLTGFAVAMDDMTLTATGKITGLAGGVPSFDNLKIKTDKYDLGRILAALPMASAGLPPGAVVEGGLGLDVTATGNPAAQDIVFGLNLDGANLKIPGALNKPKGLPLNLAFTAHLDVLGKNLDLKSFKFTVGDLALSLKGTVKNFDNPVINMTGGTGKFSINGPARLSPSVAKAIPPDVKVGGNAELDFRFSGSPSNIDAGLLLGIYGADLGVPGTTLKGSGKIQLEAKGDPAKSLAAKVDIDLSGLNVKSGDAFNKPGGTPLVVNLAATKSGDALNIGNLLVKIGPLNITGSGSTNAKSGSMDIKMKIARFKIMELAAMLPALKETPIARAQLGLDVSFSGNPSAMSSIKAGIQNFYFGLGKSSLSGDLSVANLDAPKIRFNFNAPVLDLDEMFPPSGEEAPPPDEGGAGGVPPIVSRIDMDGTIKIGRGLAGGFPFTNFIASLTLQNGVARFRNMDFKAYEGQFTMAGTNANIGAAVPSFDVKMSFKNVNARKLLADQANTKTISGRMSIVTAVKGKGADWDAISKVLSGSLEMGLKKGKFNGADIEREILVPLSKKLPGIKPPKAKGLALNDLQASFAIANGKAKLTKPMKANTPQGPLTLDGWIGLDKALNLTGTIGLKPSVIAKATRNKVKPKKPMPVGLKIGGTVDNPKISGIEVGKLAKMLAAEFARAMGLAKLEAAQKQAEAAARAAAAAAKAKVAAVANAAKAKANAAKKKALAAKKKAEAKARKKAKAAKAKAKKKAKAKAKKRLKGLF